MTMNASSFGSSSSFHEGRRVLRRTSFRLLLQTMRAPLDIGITRTLPEVHVVLRHDGLLISPPLAGELLPPPLRSGLLSGLLLALASDFDRVSEANKRLADR